MVLAGKLDLATALQADRALGATQPEAQLVILDLRQVQFIGCTAARVVLMADARARRVAADLWSSPRARRLPGSLRSAPSAASAASAAPKVAQIDIARKLTEAIWQMLPRNQRFSPTPAAGGAAFRLVA